MVETLKSIIAGVALTAATIFSTSEADAQKSWTLQQAEIQEEGWDGKCIDSKFAEHLSLMEISHPYEYLNEPEIFSKFMADKGWIYQATGKRLKLDSTGYASKSEMENTLDSLKNGFEYTVMRLTPEYRPLPYDSISVYARPNNREKLMKEVFTGNNGVIMQAIYLDYLFNVFPLPDGLGSLNREDVFTGFMHAYGWEYMGRQQRPLLDFGGENNYLGFGDIELLFEMENPDYIFAALSTGINMLGLPDDVADIWKMKKYPAAEK